MKKLLLIAILFCLGRSALAQKVYFIYIQSEANVPFYVKMGDKVYSSTASGYLILPKLKDSTYSFYLGQPGNQSKELSFSVDLKNKDRGFLLKNLEKGWVLFDLQSMATINPAASTSGVMYQSDVVKTDIFTRLLAKAVDDSTLLMEPILAAKEETKQSVAKSKNKPDVITQKVDTSNTIATVSPQSEEQTEPVEETTVTPASTAINNIANDTKNQNDVAIGEVSKIDTITQSSLAKNSTAPSATTQVPGTQNPDDQNLSSQALSDSGSNQEVPNPGNTEQLEYKRSIVKRYAESSNFQGFGLTYIDTYGSVVDTIRLVIPNVVNVNTTVPNTNTITNNGASAPQSSGNNQSPNENIEKDTLNIVAASGNSDTKAAPINNNPDTKNNSTTIKNPEIPAICQTSASDRDFSELKKNMAARARGEEMLAEARKTFREKCFSTEQIRNLGNLFLTSEGKFLFFKDARAHISDKDRFETLIFEFKEEVYKDRFKALLAN